MTPERWQKVSEILQQAWEKKGQDRSAFLDEACAGDLDLRVRVESLLACDENIGEFLESPAIHALGDDKVVDFTHGNENVQFGPYRIVREIGRGGMGTVYLAERVDGQFHKQVAIKVANAQCATEDLLRRFRNERQLLATLDHPNIARLLDGGATDDGLPYIVMEWVDGVRIDTWCDRQKFLQRDVLVLFQLVCAAVQYAHEKQVIHRDIKPGNILVTADRTPKLLDFGIAKIFGPEPPGEIIEATIGRAPLTPEYASPEQARGGKVGPASDIYALGLVLYRLLTGKPAYSEGFALPPRSARDAGRESVQSNVGARSANLSGDIKAILLKAVSEDPGKRYATVADLSADLSYYLQGRPVTARAPSGPYRVRKFMKRNRVAVGAASVSAIFALAALSLITRYDGRNAHADAGIRSIAVLPLDNLSGNREQDYFADGITDSLIGYLAHIRGLRVISRTSVMSFKGKRLPLPAIGRSLGVQTIAEGSVLRAGSRVRIAIRLIDARNDHPVWSAAYEGELKNVLSLQEQLATNIAREINLTLTVPQRGQHIPNRQFDLDAYDAYLKGRHQRFNSYTLESTQKAIAYFQQALALDPAYAAAYAGLADCYYGLSNMYYPPTEVMPKAKWAALKALQLDDTLGEAHASLAVVNSLYDFDRRAGEKEFMRALDLNPNDAPTHLSYSQHLVGLGRFDEALAEVEQTQKFDPASLGTNAYVGLPLFYARRYEKAIQLLEPLATAYPNYHHPHAFLALAYEQQRNWPKAIAEMETAYQLDSEPEALAQLGHVYAMAGRISDARKVLKDLLSLAQRRYVSAYDVAVLYAGLGDQEEAFRWLEKVEQDRSEMFAAVNVDPRLDMLHSDPRWQSILRSVGLVQ